jgi:hypothetical protein
MTKSPATSDLMMPILNWDEVSLDLKPEDLPKVGRVSCLLNSPPCQHIAGRRNFLGHDSAPNNVAPERPE